MEIACNKCGWVHFVVTREELEEDINNFNKLYEDLTPAEKERYYNSTIPTIEKYEVCFNCGNSHKDFRPAVEADCPQGSTVQAIIEG